MFIKDKFRCPLLQLTDARLSQVLERQACGTQDADNDQGNEHGAFFAHGVATSFTRAVPAL
jgi:hypothetical protein